MGIVREAIQDTDFGEVVTGGQLAAVHPGEVLLKDFIEPMGLTRYKIAQAMNVSQRRVDEICSGDRAVTADTALRLERLFGMEAQVWLNLQSQYDLEITSRASRGKIYQEVQRLFSAA